MTTELDHQTLNLNSKKFKSKDVSLASRILLFFVILTLIASFFVIVNAGERGVLMKFGKVEEKILGEGIHLIVPLVHSVEKLSVRVQRQDVVTEASSQDLQDVFSDVAINWHIIPEEVNRVYQQIGNINDIIDRVIIPAVEEIIKKVMANYTAEDIIIKREEVKSQLDQLLRNKLKDYHLKIDDISLINLHFSQRFRDAVESKQIAKQEAKKAEFIAQKAIKEAEAKINLAKGEAEAQRLIKETLTPDLLQKQALDKWDGNLPLILDGQNTKLLDFNQLMNQRQGIQP